jgi:hypothetical protein
MLNEDPVKAIKLLDNIGDKLAELKECSEGLQDENGDHPVIYIGNILYHCRNLMFQRYGKMLWYSPDGPIDQSYSKENIPNMSSEVLSNIRSPNRTEDSGEAHSDGETIQRST